jgi:hypothetical protein
MLIVLKYENCENLGTRSLYILLETGYRNGFLNGIIIRMYISLGWPCTEAFQEVRSLSIACNLYADLCAKINAW